MRWLASSISLPCSAAAWSRCALVLRACCLGAAALLCGCMTAKIEERRQAATHIQTSEAVVILAKPHLEGSGTEGEFLDCLEKELVGRKVSAQVDKASAKGQHVEARSSLTGTPFQLYAERQFIDSLYPWLEPSTAPSNAQGLSALLSRPAVAARVSEMGVRYIVWVDGSTRRIDGGGSMSCVLAPGIAGCIGLGWREKQSDYEATIWDLHDGSNVGTVSTDVSGTSVFIGAIVPVPLIAPVKKTACNRLAGQLKSFLVGAEPTTTAVRKD